MGTRYVHQGQCTVCGKYSHDYCDHCGRYVCEEHRYIKHPKYGEKEFVFCKECYDRNRPAKDPAGKKI